MQDLFDGEHLGGTPGPFRYRVTLIPRHTEGVFRNGRAAGMDRAREPKYELFGQLEIWIPCREMSREENKAAAEKELGWLHQQCWANKKDRNHKKGEGGGELSSTLGYHLDGNRLILTVGSGAHKLENREKADEKLAEKLETLQRFVERFDAQELAPPLPPPGAVRCSQPKEIHSQGEEPMVQLHVTGLDKRPARAILINTVCTRLMRAKLLSDNDLPSQAYFQRLNSHELIVRVPKDALNGKDLQTIVCDILQQEKEISPLERIAY